MKNLVVAVLVIVSAFILASVYSISAAEKAPWVKSIEANSILEFEKGTYSDGNLMDLTDDSWCEGEKDAGIGKTITIRLNAPAAVKTLHIKNGMGIQKYWAANNRVKELRINGKTYTLKDVPEFQSVGLNGLKTDELRIEIVSVYKGAKYNDTCLAELALSDPGKSFNVRDNYSKITGTSWASGDGMDGDIVTFSRGFLVSTDVVPCGDEMCPISSVGSCRRMAANRYECRFVEHCRGTYDPKLNQAGKACTPMGDSFTLDVSGGVPVVTLKGKKSALKPFD